MYFLSMKIEIPGSESVRIMSEEDANLVLLVQKYQDMFELLTRRVARDRTVIDNDFNSRLLSDAALDMMQNKITDFDWKFQDKYGRLVKCYITSAV